jgi:hypothetical protein
MKKWQLSKPFYLVLIIIGVISILGQWARDNFSLALLVFDFFLITIGVVLFVRKKG